MKLSREANNAAREITDLVETETRKDLKLTSCIKIAGFVQLAINRSAEESQDTHPKKSVKEKEMAAVIRKANGGEESQSVSDADRLATLCRELFDILEVVEVTDEGRSFSPNTIQSCRSMTVARLDKILPEIKSLCGEKAAD